MQKYEPWYCPKNEEKSVNFMPIGKNSSGERALIFYHLIATARFLKHLMQDLTPKGVILALATPVGNPSVHTNPSQTIPAILCWLMHFDLLTLSENSLPLSKKGKAFPHNGSVIKIIIINGNVSILKHTFIATRDFRQHVCFFSSLSIPLSTIAGFLYSAYKLSACNCHQYSNRQSCTCRK